MFLFVLQQPQRKTAALFKTKRTAVLYFIDPYCTVRLMVALWAATPLLEGVAVTVSV